MSHTDFLIALGMFSITLPLLGYALGKITSILLDIEHNTRPPKPDIKSFINRNTKGDK